MSTAAVGTYQLFGRLSPEQYQALERDILQRGVLIPVERDTEGNTLDGHHRQEIADKHGLPCPEMVRHFDTEADKREHVIKLNLARRHLAPHEWGAAVKTLAKDRGIVIGGKGGRPSRRPNGDENCDTVTQLADELGVS